MTKHCSAGSPCCRGGVNDYEEKVPIKQLKHITFYPPRLGVDCIYESNI